MSTDFYDTPRLSAILDKISASGIADIGTDHAYIPINAISGGRCGFAVACDIRPGPLKIAAANVHKYKLDDKIQLRLGGGLSQIKAGETGQIVIAGMGGIMIREILKNDINIAKSAESLILQPMNYAPELRRFLFDNGFAITVEDLAVEGYKVYNVMMCQKGVEKSPCIGELHIPPKLYGHKYFNVFLAKKIREFTKISDGLRKASSLSDKQKETLSEYENLLAYAYEIKKMFINGNDVVW